MTLGAICSLAEKTTLFRIWAPTAFAVDVLIFRDGSSNDPLTRFESQFDAGSGTWTYVCSDMDLNGLFYEYEIRTVKGVHRCLDPYAISMAAYTADGSCGRGAIVSLDDPRAQPDSELLARIEADAASFRASHPDIAALPACRTPDDAVIYEISVRDATAAREHIPGNAEPGTYLAFIDRIPDIASLGVTHVQLMPVLNFYNNDETDRRFEGTLSTHGNNYNWGYDPHSYFTPEGWYSSDPADPYARIRELRTLVAALHLYGLRVILDVVYNHMARTAFLDDIVPGYFFRKDDHDRLKSNSGCGNDLASEKQMARKLITDSTTHWIRNYAVDGFRFDLMGLLDTETVLESYTRAVDLKPDVLFVGEGWRMYDGAAGTAGMDQDHVAGTAGIAVFNDEFRDLAKAGGFNEQGRGLLTGEAVDTDALRSDCLGKPAFRYEVTEPAESVIYLDCHDGLTLHDAVVHNTPVDETHAPGRQEVLSRMKLAYTLLLTSQGIAFIYAGSERGRTKPAPSPDASECIGLFVRNSYDSSDEVNRIHWKPETELDRAYEPLVPYVSGLVTMRRTHTAFRMGKTAWTSYADVPFHGELGFAYMLYSGREVWLMAFNAGRDQAYILEKELVEAAAPFLNSAPDFSEGAVFADGSSAAPSPVRVIEPDRGKFVFPPLSPAVIRFSY